MVNSLVVYVGAAACAYGALLLRGSIAARDQVETLNNLRFLLILGFAPVALGALDAGLLRWVVLGSLYAIGIATSVFERRLKRARHQDAQRDRHSDEASPPSGPM